MSILPIQSVSRSLGSGCAEFRYLTGANLHSSGRKRQHCAHSGPPHRTRKIHLAATFRQSGRLEADDGHWPAGQRWRIVAKGKKPLISFTPQT